MRRSDGLGGGEGLEGGGQHYHDHGKGAQTGEADDPEHDSATTPAPAASASLKIEEIGEASDRGHQEEGERGPDPRQSEQEGRPTRLSIKIEESKQGLGFSTRIP